MWLVLAAVLIPQEFASTAVVFVLALQQNIPIWEINLIWFCTTSIDMYVGHVLGVLAREKMSDTRFGRWAERWIRRGRTELGAHGEKFSFTLLGVINFPYANTFIGAWIGMPFWTAYILTLTGNFIWLLFLWGTVLGLSSFISNPDIIILILVVAGVLSHFLFRLSRSKKG